MKTVSILNPSLHLSRRTADKSLPTRRQQHCRGTEHAHRFSGAQLHTNGRTGFFFSCSKGMLHDKSIKFHVATWKNTILLLNSVWILKVSETCCSHQKTDICEREVSLSMRKYSYICEHYFNEMINFRASWEVKKWIPFRSIFLTADWTEYNSKRWFCYPVLVGGCKVFSSTVELSQLPPKC